MTDLYPGKETLQSWHEQIQPSELAQTPRGAYCECCDLPLSSCGKAVEAKQLTELKKWRRWLIRHGWFTSNFPGQCNRCEVWFRAGTVIRSDGFSAKGGIYVAECCAPPMPGGDD